MPKLTVEIYTDGACRGNPGIGAWAAWLKCGIYEKKISDVVRHTTNNRMELLAPISALSCLKENLSYKVNIHTDSRYVRDGITRWIHNWQKNNWQIAKKKKIKNLDLWQELYVLNDKYKPNWHWVKGHSGNYGNELADELANLTIDEFLQKET